VLGGDLIVARRPRLVLRRHHHVAGAGGEPAESLARIQIGRLLGTLRHETLLRGLLGDTHTAPDVGPRGARAPGLIHEVADEVIGHLVEVFRGEHRVGQLFEGIGVHLLDCFDEIVEPHGVRHARRIGHTTTVG
jgi:hypothetical protein